MIEETDTNSDFLNKEIPDGEHTFTVDGSVRKKGHLYIWRLRYEDNQSGEHIMFANKMGDFLRVLGCTETSKGIFSWDLDTQDGKTFTAIVSHVPDKINPTKIYQRLSGFKKEEALPF